MWRSVRWIEVDNPVGDLKNSFPPTLPKMTRKEEQIQMLDFVHNISWYNIENPTSTHTYLKNTVEEALKQMTQTESANNYYIQT